ncbi:SDR family NAD(P)-dependent oxidoreductase [Haliea sp. E17]|uniref:SDR family NAD(P)-dependent oxidoreductase n=1 Tax=Haliea sp. E17 TaxID=3401576 RepID=UPI003AAE2379
MEEFRFDGRTAIVTGAGGKPGLGRAHAMLLAARGANVVVNDIGRIDAPNYTGDASAEAVAQEIRALGGNAVADTHSVATERGAAAVIDTAIEAFGGVDILVNNAGISIAAAFDEMSAADVQRHIDINLMGTVWMCRAAWPHMRQQGYGRIVNTGSGAFTGMWALAMYGAAKGGIFSLTRALAVEGQPLGIKVNTVLPGAYTRMVHAQRQESSDLYQYAQQNLPAELAAPAVAFLAHEACPVTGESLEAVGGVVRRVYVAQSEGIADRDITVEKIAANWGQVMGSPRDTVIGLGGVESEADIRPYTATGRGE